MTMGDIATRRRETSPRTVDGTVLEVLQGFGLAHVRAGDGTTYGLNHQTPGVPFSELVEGRRIRLQVVSKFNRVVHGQLLD